MKITTLNKHKTKLLKLKLVKTRVYRSEKNFNYLFLKNFETQLKKVLNIIYRFHIDNKKILFIGTPRKLSNTIKRLIKKKKHSFIPEALWMNGIVTNPKSSFKHLLKRHAIFNDKRSKLLFNLKKHADLIVVLNEKLNLTALKESSLRRVPTISLNAEYRKVNFNLSTYKVAGEYQFVKEYLEKRLDVDILGLVLLGSKVTNDTALFN